MEQNPIPPPRRQRKKGEPCIPSNMKNVLFQSILLIYDSIPTRCTKNNKDTLVVFKLCKKKDVGHNLFNVDFKSCPFVLFPFRFLMRIISGGSFFWGHGTFVFFSFIIFFSRSLHFFGVVRYLLKLSSCFF